MRIRAVMLVIIVLMLGDLVFRGIVPSFIEGKNDFTDPFVASWLWRDGTNPYDVAQATVAGKALTESPSALSRFIHLRPTCWLRHLLSCRGMGQTLCWPSWKRSRSAAWHCVLRPSAGTTCVTTRRG